MGTFNTMNPPSFKEIIKNNLRLYGARGFYLFGTYKLIHRGKVLILMYHRVLKMQDRTISFIQPGMYVTESVFRNQMEFLNTYYKIISLKELLDLWREEKLEAGKRYCIITFDDGWLDNYLYAYPILKKYRIPATIFLPTSLIGTNYWFWPDRLSYLIINKNELNKSRLKSLFSLLRPFGIKKDILSSICSFMNGKIHVSGVDGLIEKLKAFSDEAVGDMINDIYNALNVLIPSERTLLNWEEVREMSQNGINFGSHTCTHRILTNIPLKEVRRELEESMRMLKAKKINYVSVFAYPNGSYNREIQELTRECGYEAAVSTTFGFEDGCLPNIFSLKRISLHNDITMTLPLFTFHLSGLPRILKRAE
jgi:peptidoglycan/xylan/chitin deacetylase (PgdA/CDA1 family)